MNAGQITERYAKAFYDLVKKHSCEEQAYAQARVLLSTLSRNKSFREYIHSPHRVDFDKKIELLNDAVSPDGLCHEYVDLLALMTQNGRSEHFRIVLLDFLKLYREEHKILMLQVTAATDQADNLVPDIEDVFRKLGYTARVRVKKDPSVIGGVLLESWNYRFDGTVRKALERVARELTKKEKKLI